MFTALTLKWYVTSNTHNPNWKSFNISQCFTLFSLLFPAPGSESSHIFRGLPWCKNLWSFLCILAIIFHGSIVLTSHWPLCVHCFKLLVSFTGFYTEDEPIFCLLGAGKSALRAEVSPGRTLRFDGIETTASIRLLFHRACMSTWWLRISNDRTATRTSTKQ